MLAPSFVTRVNLGRTLRNYPSTIIHPQPCSLVSVADGCRYFVPGYLRWQETTVLRSQSSSMSQSEERGCQEIHLRYDSICCNYGF